MPPETHTPFAPPVGFFHSTWKPSLFPAARGLNLAKIMNQSEINDLLERNPNAASETECARLRAQRDRLREACEAACRAAADCLPPSGEGELDAMYYKAKLQAIDEAAAKCSAALKESGE